MGKIQPRTPRGAAGSVDRRNVVVDLAIGVECEPVTNPGKSIGEIECAEAGAWIFATELFCSGNPRDTKEAFQKGMDCDRHVTLAAPDDGALKAEFQIFGRLEAYLLDMDPR